jgi:hypothetical protein
MPATIIVPGLAAALSAIGNAHVYIGNPFSAGGMAPLGQKEGAITMTITDEINELKAPEQTGPVVHQATVMGSTVSGSIPMIVDAAGLLYAKISPLGTAGGGSSVPTPVVPTCLLIIPDTEVGVGLTYSASTWVPAAPIHAVWIWRAYLSRGQESWDVANGGKKIVAVNFTGMYATQGGVPEGQKVWTRGNPVTAGVTGLAL